MAGASNGAVYTSKYGYTNTSLCVYNTTTDLQPTDFGAFAFSAITFLVRDVTDDFTCTGSVSACARLPCQTVWMLVCVCVRVRACVCASVCEGVCALRSSV